MNTALSRAWRRLTMTPDQLDAARLSAEAKARGGTAIIDLQERSIATVSGAVRSIILRPSTEVPALVAELYDGTEPLTLVWLGRRQIAGIHPGSVLTAKGRVTRYKGVKTIFNPAYEIVSTHG
jgi:RecG-like helicase